MPRGKSWTVAQDRQLRQLLAQRPEPEVGRLAYWAEIAAALPGPERTGNAAQNRATNLGLRYIHHAPLVLIRR